MPDPSDITRFTSKRPAFMAPKNTSALEAMAPRTKDNTPAPSVVSRVQADGNFDLAALIAASHTLAKQNAKVIEGDKKPRQARAVKGEIQEPATVAKEAAPKFQPNDVVDDTTFIKLTRSLDAHSPEAQRYFWANGGEYHLVAGLTLANAWDNLRREKMMNIRNANKPVSANVAKDEHATIRRGSLFVVGPTEEDRIRRQEAAERSERILTNRRWAGIDK